MLLSSVEKLFIILANPRVLENDVVYVSIYFEGDHLNRLLTRTYLMVFRPKRSKLKVNFTWYRSVIAKTFIKEQ